MSRLVERYQKLNKDRDFIGLYHSRLVSLVLMVWLSLIVLVSVLRRELELAFLGWPTAVFGFGSVLIVGLAVLDTVVGTILERRRSHGDGPPTP